MVDFFRGNKPPGHSTSTLTSVSTTSAAIVSSSALRQLDIALVVDTTGSMSGSIAETQRRLNELIHQLTSSEVKPTVRFGLVAYRDHPPQDTTYVTRIFEFTDISKRAQSNIDSVSAQGGGDGPEAVVDRLYDALEKLSWHLPAHKVLMLVGDAPPHGKGASGDGFPKGCPCDRSDDSAVALAISKGIVIHAVGVRNDSDMQKTFRRIAEVSGGVFVSLETVDSLIEMVLALLERELDKVKDDIDVYEGLTSGLTAAEIARSTGKTADEMEGSIERLIKKGVAPQEGEAEEKLRTLIEVA